jgi:hypothetical protein
MRSFASALTGARAWFSLQNRLLWETAEAFFLAVHDRRKERAEAEVATAGPAGKEFILQDLEEVEANFGHGEKTGYQDWSSLGDERV